MAEMAAMITEVQGWQDYLGSHSWIEETEGWDWGAFEEVDSINFESFSSCNGNDNGKAASGKVKKGGQKVVGVVELE